MGFADFDIMGKCKTIIEKVEEIKTNLSEVKTSASGAKTSADSAKASADAAASNTSVIGATGNTGGSATAGTVMGKLNKLITDLTTHIGVWTSTRAGYVDNIRSYTATNNTASKTGVLSSKLAYVISLLENTTYGLNAIKSNSISGPIKFASFTRKANVTATSDTKVVCNISGKGIMKFAFMYPTFVKSNTAGSGYGILKITVDGNVVYNIKTKSMGGYTTANRVYLFSPDCVLPVSDSGSNNNDIKWRLPASIDSGDILEFSSIPSNTTSMRYIESNASLQELSAKSSGGTFNIGILDGGIKFSSSLKVEYSSVNTFYSSSSADTFFVEYVSVGYILE